jgi:hypothetical protein
MTPASIPLLLLMLLILENDVVFQVRMMTMRLLQKIVLLLYSAKRSALMAGVERTFVVG